MIRKTATFVASLGCGALVTLVLMNDVNTPALAQTNSQGTHLQPLKGQPLGENPPPPPSGVHLQPLKMKPPRTVDPCGRLKGAMADLINKEQFLSGWAQILNQQIRNGNVQQTDLNKDIADLQREVQQLQAEQSAYNYDASVVRLAGQGWAADALSAVAQAYGSAAQKLQTQVNQLQANQQSQQQVLNTASVGYQAVMTVLGQLAGEWYQLNAKYNDSCV